MGHMWVIWAIFEFESTISHINYGLYIGHTGYRWVIYGSAMVCMGDMGQFYIGYMRVILVNTGPYMGHIMSTVLYIRATWVM